jgi:hypothetical protein
MRGYCEEALRYGEMPLLNGSRPRHIGVILNPAANKRYVKHGKLHACGVPIRPPYSTVKFGSYTNIGYWVRFQVLTVMNMKVF